MCSIYSLWLPKSTSFYLILLFWYFCMNGQQQQNGALTKYMNIYLFFIKFYNSPYDGCIDKHIYRHGILWNGNILIAKCFSFFFSFCNENLWTSTPYWMCVSVTYHLDCHFSGELNSKMITAHILRVLEHCQY